MENRESTAKPLTWFEQIFENMGLVNTNPELSPYLDVDKFPEYQAKVTASLISQGLPLTPPKSLQPLTPEKLGLLLGQQCGTLYALGDYMQSLSRNPQAIRQGKKNLRILRTQRQVPGVSSVLHAGRITELMMAELAKDFPQFEKNVHAAFKAALDQPSHQEAVEFFRGYATGIAKPGIKDGKLVRGTKATQLQMKMFMHTEQAGEMKTVAEWRAFLLKNGETEETLGDDERLQKFCTRIGYAPGKKKHNPGKNK